MTTRPPLHDEAGAWLVFGMLLTLCAFLLILVARISEPMR